MTSAHIVFIVAVALALGGCAADSGSPSTSEPPDDKRPESHGPVSLALSFPDPCPDDAKGNFTKSLEAPYRGCGLGPVESQQAGGRCASFAIDPPLLELVAHASKVTGTIVVGMVTGNYPLVLRFVDESGMVGEQRLNMVTPVPGPVAIDVAIDFERALSGSAWFGVEAEGYTCTGVWTGENPPVSALSFSEGKAPWR